jgi:F-type H+-transporting ATPase subunit delta
LATNALQAKRYAQAIFEIALENKELDKWKKDIQVLGYLANNSEFTSVMENPQFAFENKIKLMDSQIKGIGKLAVNLASILIGKGKFRIFSQISAEYLTMLDLFYGIEKAEVTTAIKLEDQEIAKMADQLGTLTGKKITMSVHIDPQIIGGIIVRIGGKIIDGSTRGQLMALRSEMLGYRG